MGPYSVRKWETEGDGDASPGISGRSKLMRNEASWDWVNSEKSSSALGRTGGGLKMMESGRRISEKRIGLTVNYKQTGLIHLS